MQYPLRKSGKNGHCKLQMIFHLETQDHGTHWYNDISTPPPKDSARTPHASLYNWSRILITTWRWPTYMAETCCCYNILHVIIEANIVVFNCKYNTPSSLLLYKTQWGWHTSESGSKHFIERNFKKPKLLIYLQVWKLFS